MNPSTPSIDLPAPRSLPSLLPSLLGEGEPLRTQTFGVVFSTATYLLYGLITWYQVRVGLMRSDIGWTCVTEDFNRKSTISSACKRRGLQTNWMSSAQAR